MTWQFWVALFAFAVASALGIRREIINRRFVCLCLDSLLIREMNVIEAERKCICDRDAYGRQRHLFGIAQGYREARREAERLFRRDW